MVSWATAIIISSCHVSARTFWLNLLRCLTTPHGSTAPEPRRGRFVQKGPPCRMMYQGLSDENSDADARVSGSVSVIIIIIIIIITIIIMIMITINNVSIIGMILIFIHINHILIIHQRQSEGNGELSLQHWFKLWIIKPSGREPSLPGCKDWDFRLENASAIAEATGDFGCWTI